MSNSDIDRYDTTYTIYYYCQKNPENCGFNDDDLCIGIVFNAEIGIEHRCLGVKKRRE